MDIAHGRRSARPVRRTQAERSGSTQQRILEAALRIVQASGFQKATMQEIAREAGVSLGALQHHYGSKETLVEAVIEYVFKGSEIDGDVWPDASQPLQQRTDDFLKRAWRHIYGKPAYLASWHLHFGCQASPTLSARINAKREPWSESLTRLFLERFPEIRESFPDPEGFARLVFTSLRGVAVLAVFGDTLADNEDQLSALSETIQRAARNRPVRLAPPTPQLEE